MKRWLAADQDATFYVVAFHWGWGVFDSEGRELDGINVSEGTAIELFAVNDAAEEAISRLPGPVAAAINAVEWDTERVRSEIAAGRLQDPETKLGMSLEDVMNGNDSAVRPAGLAAWQTPWLGERRELETHGFLIPWYGVAVKLEPDATEPFRTAFIADRPGAFEFVCTVYCGYGHQSQPREMLFVAAAQSS